ncbi:MAG: acyl-CoA thioesterase, partial [Arcicella sp.]|nr:acyl-CoA thioesterase [Arcicella sp.]
ITETEEEKELFDGALRRRQLRLVLAGRMKPSEAVELRSLFEV